MKIIIANAHNDYILTGLASSLTASPIQTIVWGTEVKPALDMMYEIKPDIVICKDTDLNPELCHAIRQNKEINIVVIGLQIPGILFTVNQPKLVCIPEDTEQDLIDNLPNHFSHLIIKNAADVARYRNGKYNRFYKSDVLYISEFELENRPYVISELVNYMHKYKFKICGGYAIPCCAYLGVVDMYNIVDLMASTTVNIDYDGDILLDAAANKCFTVTNIDNDLYPTFNNTDELINHIDHFLENDKHRKSCIKKAYKQVIENDTYFHRAKDILLALNYQDGATQVMDTLSKLRT